MQHITSQRSCDDATAIEWNVSQRGHADGPQCCLRSHAGHVDAAARGSRNWRTVSSPTTPFPTCERAKLCQCLLELAVGRQHTYQSRLFGPSPGWKLFRGQWPACNYDGPATRSIPLRQHQSADSGRLGNTFAGLSNSTDTVGKQCGARLEQQHCFFGTWDAHVVIGSIPVFPASADGQSASRRLDLRRLWSKQLFFPNGMCLLPIWTKYVERHRDDADARVPTLWSPNANDPDAAHGDAVRRWTWRATHGNTKCDGWYGTARISARVPDDGPDGYSSENCRPTSAFAARATLRVQAATQRSARRLELSQHDLQVPVSFFESFFEFVCLGSSFGLIFALFSFPATMPAEPFATAATPLDRPKLRSE